MVEKSPKLILLATSTLFEVVFNHADKYGLIWSGRQGRTLRKHVQQAWGNGILEKSNLYLEQDMKCFSSMETVCGPANDSIKGNTMELPLFALFTECRGFIYFTGKDNTGPLNISIQVVHLPVLSSGFCRIFFKSGSQLYLCAFLRLAKFSASPGLVGDHHGTLCKMAMQSISQMFQLNYSPFPAVLANFFAFNQVEFPNWGVLEYQKQLCLLLYLTEPVVTLQVHHRYRLSSFCGQIPLTL